MNRLSAILLTTVGLMTCVAVAVAQLPHAAATRIPVRSDSRLWLEGSSNIRDWTCRATALEASVAIDASGGSAAPGSSREVVRGVSVNVPVRMLKCGDRHMEAEMYLALKSPKTAPGYITAEADRIPQGVVEGKLVEAEAMLTIAGVRKNVKMTVTSDVLPDGTRRARGTVPILMTDFGIKPPRPWGGILRTADKVLIQFEIFIAGQS
ncbi:MAG: YceI family protein [Gemmatimonadaceae bacterium]